MKARDSRVAYFRKDPVLVYHKVQPGIELGVTTVHPRVFRKHIQWIRQQQFTPITFQTLITTPESHLPAKPIIISFDDGFASVAEYAFPVMQEAQIPGVVFAISGFLGKRGVWDVNLGSRAPLHLSGEQLRSLVQQGWEIGSHTVTHRALPFLNTAELKEELDASRCHLEDTIGAPVKTIAFPFGLTNSRVLRASQRAGYIFATGSPFLSRWEGQPIVFPRIPVFPWDTPGTLEKKIAAPQALTYQITTRIIRWPAVFSPIYQLLFRRFLWK